MAEETKNPVGRPTVMTPEVVSKLDEAFSMGCTDTEACLFANISRETLYKYERENPKYTDRKEELKERPFLKARSTIINSLDNPRDAQWYMERKKKKEFAHRQELTGEEGQPLTITLDNDIAQKNEVTPGTKGDSEE